MSARAVLRLDMEGAADIVRSIGQIRGVVRAAQSAMSAEARRGAQDRTRIATQEGRAEAAAATASARERVRAEREASRAVAAEARRREQSEKAAAKERERAEKAATKVTEREAKTRTQAEAAAAREVETIARRTASAREREERRTTRNMKAQERQRTADARAAAQERQNLLGGAGQAVGAVARGATTYATNAHGEIQGVRRTAAQRETALNDILIQTGAGRGEVASQRNAITSFAAQQRLDPDAVIAAVSEAQSRFNALGGSTTGERNANLQATLQDVGFASAINPNRMGGLTAFGAMLHGRVSDEMRHSLLRNAAGISFEGSKETDEALQQGLPSMLRSLNTSLAGANPADRDRITQAAVTDYLAQIQTSAASGGRIGVTGNRMNTLRTSLSNAYTQNRLGAALAARDMTDEQRAEFNQTFTRGRNGQYTLNADAVNSPSNFARFMGHQFGDNPAAVANFLGTHGGGGARQLLTRPVTDLVTSYFADSTDAQGRTVKQYDAVNSLARATITPEREAEIRAIRESEDQRRLNADEAARTAALRRPGVQQRASDIGASVIANNPLGVIGLSAGSTAVPAGFAGIGRMMGLSGATGVGGGAGLLAQLGGGAANLGAMLTGRGADGSHLSMFDRFRRATAFAAAPAAMMTGPLGLLAGSAMMAAPGLRDLGRGAIGAGADAVKGTGLAELLISQLPARIGTEVARAIRDNPPMISPHDVAHAATAAASGRNPAPPSAR